MQTDGIGPHQIVGMADGSGTTLERIMQGCESGEISAKVALILTNNPKAKVIAMPTKPIDSEMRAPYKTRVNRSRPRRSVPIKKSGPSSSTPKRWISVRQMPQNL